MNKSKIKLSIIVVFYNMQREAVRTLLSLSPKYQNNVQEEDYEVIAIDNGSSQPLDPSIVAGFGTNFIYRFFDTRSVSPVDAINLGADMAQGEALAVIVDGARMATPGLIEKTLAAYGAVKMPCIAALSWHLGPDIQPKSLQAGYNQATEDRLIASINWPEDGYRLFEIATLAPSSRPGFYGGVPPEFSWFCISREVFQRVGGFNPSFQSPGGGLCNHEFRNRIVNTSNINTVILLGDGVFHQCHGGVSTNVPRDQHPYNSFQEEYKALFGIPLEKALTAEPVYFGALPEPALQFLNPAVTGSQNHN